MHSSWLRSVLVLSALFNSSCLPGFTQDSAQASTKNSAKGTTQVQSSSKATERKSASETVAPQCCEGEPHAMAPSGFGAHAHRIMNMLSSSGVELTDDQVERFATSRRQFMTQVMPAKDRACLLLPDLKDALSAPDLDDDKIRAVFAKLKTEIDGVYAQGVDHLIAAAHIFTPDQRHKLRIAIDRMELGPLGTAKPAP